MFTYSRANMPLGQSERAYYLSYFINDYNGLVWGQEANPIANKSEYIREWYALRKSLKGPKYKKQKKELNVLQSKENQRSLKIYNFNCLCKL